MTSCTPCCVIADTIADQEYIAYFAITVQELVFGYCFYLNGREKSSGEIDFIVLWVEIITLRIAVIYLENIFLSKIRVFFQYDIN